MNQVVLIGRLTRDPEITYTAATQTCVATFNIAVDRYGKDKQADFPRIKVLGKQAENCEKYLKKGLLVGVQGSIQTGSYEGKNGPVYTTDVLASRIEFLQWADKKDAAPSGFQELEEDIPF